MTGQISKENKTYLAKVISYLAKTKPSLHNLDTVASSTIFVFGENMDRGIAGPEGT